MSVRLESKPTRNSTEDSTLAVLMAEVEEYYKLSRQAFQRMQRAKSDSDDLDEATGDLSASAFVLELKAQAINEFLDHEDYESLVVRLERVRAKLSITRLMSVGRFLEHIKQTLKVPADIVPTEATYRRWLGQAKRGIIKISPAHESMLARFLDKQSKTPH